MKRVGIVGWRGMVGSLLMQRMHAERDFALMEPVFFSTSRVGGIGPFIGKETAPLKDAKSVKELALMDVVISCQGGDYTNEVFPKLRASGWKGYWIDAASALRMRDDAVIILDPVNMNVIREALSRGVRNYIGGNCTVSLMLMGLHGLLEADLVDVRCPQALLRRRRQRRRRRLVTEKIRHLGLHAGRGEERRAVVCARHERRRGQAQMALHV